MQKRQEYEPQSPSWFDDNDFRNHILNEKNIPLTKKFLNEIFKTYDLDHKVQNLEMFQLAMTHVSYGYKNRSVISDKVANMLKVIPPIDKKFKNTVMDLTENNYEALEWRGDGIAHGIITQYICDRYPEKKEGFFTKLRAKLEQCNTFSQLGKKLGLHKYAIIARNMELENARENNNHLTEDLFEAFLGALSMEISHEQLSKFLICIIERELDLGELISQNDNYKDLLMQYFHKMRWSEPKYVDATIQKNLPNNNTREFITHVVKDNKIISIGKGDTKLKAEQISAKNALQYLGQEETKYENDENTLYGMLSDSEEGEIYEVDDE
jgi:dsRNA-specific ribonuclease